MGGPCRLVEEGREGSRSRPAPPCTDNFQVILVPIIPQIPQIAEFTYSGEEWHSVEQAYQVVLAVVAVVVLVVVMVVMMVVAVVMMTVVMVAAVEPAHQAMKFPPGSRDRARLAACRPGQGEPGASHGMR